MMKFTNNTIRKSIFVLFLSFAASGVSLPSQAITVQEVPRPKPHSWVTDTIHLINQKTKTKINKLIDQIEAKNSCEIAIVTVPETSPYKSPREFALTWFHYWNIGKKGLDNGVLLMYTKGENRIEIVTGWEIIEIFPDNKVVNLIKTEIRPRVNKQDFSGAMLVGTQEIIKALDKYQPHPSHHGDTKSADSNSVFYVLGTIIGLIIVFFPFMIPVFLIWLCITGKKGRRGDGGGGEVGGGGGCGGCGGGGCGGGCGGGGGG
jgi:uncharacterized protein